MNLRLLMQCRSYRDGNLVPLNILLAWFSAMKLKWLIKTSITNMGIKIHLEIQCVMIEPVEKRFEVNCVKCWLPKPFTENINIFFRMKHGGSNLCFNQKLWSEVQQSTWIFIKMKTENIISNESVSKTMEKFIQFWPILIKISSFWMQSY